MSDRYPGAVEVEVYEYVSRLNAEDFPDHETYMLAYMLEDQERVHVGTVERSIVQMDRWQKVRYNNQWYQLFGGFRTGYFIDLNFPLKGEQNV